jgi:hypothetical protein
VTVAACPGSTALYRVFGDADLLLYIGISKDFGGRWKQHARTQPWWGEMRRLTVDCWFDSRAEAEAAEKAVIADEQPKYNVMHRKQPERPGGHRGGGRTQDDIRGKPYHDSAYLDYLDSPEHLAFLEELREARRRHEARRAAGLLTKNEQEDDEFMRSLGTSEYAG